MRLYVLRYKPVFAYKGKLLCLSVGRLNEQYEGDNETKDAVGPGNNTGQYGGNNPAPKKENGQCERKYADHNRPGWKGDEQQKALIGVELGKFGIWCA